MVNDVVKRTPLYQEHVASGARMMDFAGWSMPVEYEGLRAEHMWVRAHVGVFDVSHMGEIRCRGPQALTTLQWVTTNNVSRLQSGQAQYSLFPNDVGGIVDDVIVYCIHPNQDYLLCVNAANVDKDFAWLQKHNRGSELTDESSQWGQIAVQGPQAVALVEKIFEFDASLVRPFHFVEKPFHSAKCLLARTGYTGEDGFEIFVPDPTTISLWQELVRRGAHPIGLGARDTLRTEMKYSLYGHEINNETNPYAAGLGWVVKPDKKDFLGRQKIISAKEQGLPQKLIGFRMIEKGIARHGYRLLSQGGRAIGHVTSGTPSPTLNENIGIGYLDVAFSAVGTEIWVDIRGRPIKAQVVDTPFVTTTSLSKK